MWHGVHGHQLEFGWSHAGRPQTRYPPPTPPSGQWSSTVINFPPVAAISAAIALPSMGFTQYKSMTRIAVPDFFSSSAAFSASCNVTAAPMTVTLSPSLLRRTLNPGIGNFSSLEYTMGNLGREVRR